MTMLRMEISNSFVIRISQWFSIPLNFSNSISTNKSFSFNLNEEWKLSKLLNITFVQVSILLIDNCLLLFHCTIAYLVLFYCYNVIPGLLNCFVWLSANVYLDIYNIYLMLQCQCIITAVWIAVLQNHAVFTNSWAALCPWLLGPGQSLWRQLKSHQNKYTFKSLLI